MYNEYKIIRFRRKCLYKMHDSIRSAILMNHKSEKPHRKYWQETYGPRKQ